MVQDRCEVFCFDEKKVDRLKDQINHLETLNVVKIFKALADDTRMKVTYALCVEEEVCVCDIANTIGCTLATASHHLRLLRNMGLAHSRKEGKQVFYSLENSYIKQIVLQAFAQEDEVDVVGASK